jgi:hypothetical protein
MRFLQFLPLLAAFTFSIKAEPPAKLDCTIQSWNEAWKKERAHDYDTGYSTTKVAPADIAWLKPGISPVGRPGKIGPTTHGFVVLGACSKGNITSSAELQNIMIKLSKLASDHGANAISYEKSGTELRFQFLRIHDQILNAGRHPQQASLPSGSR